jgi:hypothetical protein
LGRCLARWVSQFINLVLEDPITQDRIAHTIHLGMCQFLHHSPEKIADLSPVLARKHGEDFPKIIANFFAGLFMQSPTKKQPTQQKDDTRSASPCHETTTTQLEQSSKTASPASPTPWMQAQPSRNPSRNKVDTSMDIPDLVLATPEQQDYYSTNTHTTTDPTVKPNNPKTRSSASSQLRTLKSFPSFQKRNSTCPPDSQSLDHSYHSNNNNNTSSSSMEEDPNAQFLLQIRMLEMEEYFDAVDIAQCVLSETSSIVYDPS